jgi:hypothetical protein
LFCLHAYLSIPVGEATIPFGAAIVVALSISLAKGQKWNSQVVLLVLLILAVASLGIIFGPHAKAFLVQRILTTGYFLASLFVALVTYYNLYQWPRETLRRFFGTIAIVLLIGAILEQLTPLKDISNAFRTAVSSHGVYNEDLRDLSEAGIIRPKLFALEPSILAQGIGITSLLWLMLAHDQPWKFVKFTTLILGGLVIVRSPSLFVFFPAGLFATYLWRQPGSARQIRIFRRIVISTLAAIVSAPILYLIISTFMSGRLQKVLAGTDQSTIARLVVPPYLTWDVLSHHPLFGMGLGGKNAIVDKTLNVALGFHLDVRQLIMYGGIKELFPLPILEYWATFGLLGGGLIFYCLRKLQQIMAPQDGFLILFIIACFSLTGSYVGGAYFWSVCALLGATSYVRWQTSAKPFLRSAPSPSRTVASLT